MKLPGDEIFRNKIDTQTTDANLPEINADEFEKVVRSRRSIRVFDKSVTIPEEITRRCLELAVLAPNSSNLQTWEFFWVRDQAKKQALAKACLSQPAATTAQELIVCVAHPERWKYGRDQMLKLFDAKRAKGEKVPESAYDYYKKLVPIVYTQGWLNIFGIIKKIFSFFVGLRSPIPREPFSHSDMKTWAEKSSALACQNLMLAFRAFGFDTCPMEGFDSHRVKKLLGLSRKSQITMVISAGKRTSQGVYGPQARFDSAQVIHEI